MVCYFPYFLSLSTPTDIVYAIRYLRSKIHFLGIHKEYILSFARCKGDYAKARKVFLSKEFLYLD